MRRNVDGRVHRCEFDPAPLEQADEWIARHRALWENALDRLTDFMTQGTGERPAVRSRSETCHSRVAFEALRRVHGSFEAAHLVGAQGRALRARRVRRRVGGHYRIDNELPDGRIVVIRGQFVVVERNRQLVCTWSTDGVQVEPLERVTVRFEPHPLGTEITILHERIADEELREGHMAGWEGCVDGLVGQVFETRVPGRLRPRNDLAYLASRGYDAETRPKLDLSKVSV